VSESPPARVETPPLPAALGERLGFMLIRATAGASRLAEETLEPLGIDARHYGVLALIAELGPLSQQALAELLHVDRSTMVALVDELEERRLARRRRNPADRRAYAIEATPLGVRTQRRAVKLLDKCERHYLTPLTIEEQRQFYELLARLVAQNPAEGRR
jgi:DNA-binding MarR family transcriptional regulator